MRPAAPRRRESPVSRACIRQHSRSTAAGRVARPHASVRVEVHRDACVRRWMLAIPVVGIGKRQTRTGSGAGSDGFDCRRVGPAFNSAEACCEQYLRLAPRAAGQRYRTIASVVGVPMCRLSLWRHSDRRASVSRASQRGVGAGAAESNLHMQMVDLARLLASPASGEEQERQPSSAAAFLCAETRTGRSTRRRGALPTQTPRLVRRALGRRHTPYRASSPQPLHRRDRSTATTRSREPVQTVARRSARGARSRPRRGVPTGCSLVARAAAPCGESAALAGVGIRPTDLAHRPPARRLLGLITTVGPSNAGTAAPMEADHADSGVRAPGHAKSSARRSSAGRCVAHARSAGGSELADCCIERTSCVNPPDEKSSNRGVSGRARMWTGGTSPGPPGDPLHADGALRNGKSESPPGGSAGAKRHAPAAPAPPCG